MFQPKYSLTNQIVQNIVDLEVSRSKISDVAISNRLEQELVSKSTSLNLFHFAHMIGVDITIKDAEKIAAGKKVETEDSRGQILNNFRSIQQFLDTNANTNFLDVDIKSLMHLNKLLLTDWKEDWEVKFRSFEEPANGFLDDWLVLLDKDIPLNMIQNELISVFEWYAYNANQVPAIIRIAVVFYRLLQIAPFVHLNKYTQITMLQLMLIKNKYLANSHLSIIRNVDIYAQEFIDSMLHASSNQNDLTIWVERFTYYFAKEAKAVEEQIAKLTSTDNKTSKQPFLNLNKRQLKILRYLQTIPTVRREDYVQMMDVSAMTAFRDMNDLLNKKLVKTSGKGRATRYMLASR